MDEILNIHQPTDKELGVDHAVIRAESIVMGGLANEGLAIEQLRRERLAAHQAADLERARRSISLNVAGTTLGTVDI